jgi:hypothetical protein
MPPLGHFSLIRFATLSRFPGEPVVPAPASMYRIGN